MKTRIFCWSKLEKNRSWHTHTHTHTLSRDACTWIYRNIAIKTTYSCQCSLSYYLGIIKTRLYGNDTRTVYIYLYNKFFSGTFRLQENLRKTIFQPANKVYSTCWMVKNTTIDISLKSILLMDAKLLSCLKDFIHFFSKVREKCFLQFFGLFRFGQLTMGY